MPTLREQLIGAWHLVSYTEIPVDGSAPLYPFTEAPQGIILYTPDGYMSAQLCKPGRTPFASGDWRRGTSEEYELGASTYVAYSGQFEVDESAHTLTHVMVVSLFPNWAGQAQPRIVKLEGDFLYLGTGSPIQSSGTLVNASLKWQRAIRVAVPRFSSQ